MPFTIPNLNDTEFASQAEVDSVDFSILASSINNHIISGCEVTEQNPTSMGISVSEGTIFFNENQNFISIDDTDLILSASHATLPRFTLITVDNSGVLDTIDGTELSTPRFPDFPGESTIILAAIYVPNGISEIENNYIIDKRVFGNEIIVSKGITLFSTDSTVTDSGSITFGQYDSDLNIITLDKSIRILTSDNSFINATSLYVDDTVILRSSGGGVLFNSAIFPDFNASKITAGTFNTARIPNLNASKINAGILNVLRIPDLSADKITSGELNQNRISGLSANKITSGELNLARVPHLSDLLDLAMKLFSIRLSSQDFNTLIAAGNANPLGIWSDGTTMWVSDLNDNKIYAYSLSSKERDASQDFDTLAAAGNTSPYAIWSNLAIMWVVDSVDDKIYAYDKDSKERDAPLDFDTLAAAGNTSPVGIWSDGTTMWVSDLNDNKIYAYSLSSKERDASEDFDTLVAAGNTSPVGIWSDGSTMWVVDSVDDKIYAYSLFSKSRIASQDFDTLITAVNTSPVGIWSDGTTMWVVDSSDGKIYAYCLGI